MSGPTWYQEAVKLIGVREIPGPKSNPTIMGWVARLGTRVLGMNYTNDDTPWCGVFVAHCIALRGLKTATIAVRAKSWASWGRALDKTKPILGAVLVFERKGGGHVGFCSGYTLDRNGDISAYRVLGGNQNNAVNHTFIPASRCIAQRWPAESVQLLIYAPVVDNLTGEVSRTEA